MPAARKRATAPTPSPVPALHFWMIMVVGVLLVLLLILHFFAPESKAEFYVVTATGLIGFLTGKFTNSYGKPLAPVSPKVHAVPADDSEEEGDTEDA